MRSRPRTCSRPEGHEAGFAAERAWRLEHLVERLSLVVSAALVARFAQPLCRGQACKSAARADGSGQRRLARNVVPDTLVWAPRGREIGFVSERDGNVEVYVINANGSGQRNLTRNEAREQSPPSWSPNGRKIAFVSDREGDDEVYVMNANGTGQLRLTRKPGNEILPVWSPRRKS